MKRSREHKGADGEERKELGTGAGNGNGLRRELEPEVSGMAHHSSPLQKQSPLVNELKRRVAQATLKTPAISRQGAPRSGGRCVKPSHSVR